MTSIENNRRYMLKCRLRKQLEKRKESLADDFQFKIYTIFHFEQKPCTVYESIDVVNVMTNDLKDQVLKNSKSNGVDGPQMEADDLFLKDIVQLHLTRWKPLMPGTNGSATNIDFLIYPRKDVTKIECLLFSRWKDQSMQAYLPLQCKFNMRCDEWRSKLQRMTEGETKAPSGERIVTNDEKNLFLFIKKHQIHTNAGKVMNLMKMNGLCLYVPQDQLLSWQPYSSYDILRNYY